MNPYFYDNTELFLPINYFFVVELWVERQGGGWSTFFRTRWQNPKNSPGRVGSRGEFLRIDLVHENEGCESCTYDVDFGLDSLVY